MINLTDGQKAQLLSLVNRKVWVLVSGIDNELMALIDAGFVESDVAYNGNIFVRSTELAEEYLSFQSQSTTIENNVLWTPDLVLARAEAYYFSDQIDSNEEFSLSSAIASSYGWRNLDEWEQLPGYVDFAITKQKYLESLVSMGVMEVKTVNGVLSYRISPDGRSAVLFNDLESWIAGRSYGQSDKDDHYKELKLAFDRLQKNYNQHISLTKMVYDQINERLTEANIRIGEYRLAHDAQSEREERIRALCYRHIMTRLHDDLGLTHKWDSSYDDEDQYLSEETMTKLKSAFLFGEDEGYDDDE